jgi:hypothetical protein
MLVGSFDGVGWRGGGDGHLLVGGAREREDGRGCCFSTGTSAHPSFLSPPPPLYMYIIKPSAQGWMDGTRRGHFPVF